MFVILPLLVGCKKPLTEPELQDPIYKDLVSEYSNSQKAVADQEKKVEEAKAALATIIPQTGQSRKIYRKYFDEKSRLTLLKQQEEYFRVRSNSRKFEARAAYLKALEAEAEWPDPNEYASYQREKELKSRSRNWRDRTPSYDSLKAYEERQAQEASKASDKSKQ